MSFIDVILTAGRSVVELSLFVLLPIMVVMLCLMRVLERYGVVDWAIARLTPAMRPVGLTGLSVFAMVQVSFVSFAAPISTLITMERRGTSDRHLASTLAMVLAMGQANVLFPLLAVGLDMLPALLMSLLGGLVAAAVTYHLLGKRLAGVHGGGDPAPARHDPNRSTLIAVIQEAGREATQLAFGIIPMVLLALVAVMLLREAGGFALLERWVAPVLLWLHLDPNVVLPTLTKYIAGGTAAMGLMVDLQRNGYIDAHFINATAGWLINSLDVPGVAILMAATPRLAKVWQPAVLGAMVGIVVRTVGHGLLM